jgi:hypothetical protein
MCALLNSESYGKLAGASATANTRQPGKFMAVFITGEPREGQKQGQLQVMYDFDGGKYILNNVDEVLFIPYFIKRYWEKYVKASGRTGEYDKLVAFGWNDDVPKIDDTCKYSYTIAGLLLDPKTKKAMPLPEDVKDSGMKKGDPALIHFKCGGVKFNGAMKLIDEFAKKSKELQPLSDNPEFEKSVVTPRRYIVKATVGIQETAHGNKNVFNFSLVTGLPDKAVEQVMQSAMTLLPEFEKQFDRTAFVKGGSTAPKQTQSQQRDAPKFEDTPGGDEAQTEAPASDENFDLGI